jgi:methylglutaconyl-CoA hydratase
MATTERSLDVEIRDGVAHVLFNRPAVRNAFDDAVAAELVSLFAELGARDDLRAVVLGGRGEIFCAGGDLNWMKRVASYTREENLEDAAAFQAAFEAVETCPLPVVARVQGAALGGGAGLVAVADVAVAAEGTRFGFPEARLGLVPGVISPYVLRKIGMSRTRHLFLTGERFDAAEALRIGLVHVVVPDADLDEAIGSVLRKFKACAPQAISGGKVLLRKLQDADTEAAQALARDAITDARASDDGSEGLSAFLEKRKPGWLS